MKKLLLIFSLLAVTLSVSTSCKDDEYESAWKEYAEWRETNEQYLADQARLENPDGKAVYERVIPSWNPGVYVLIRYFNDRKLTEGNLVPLSTSTVDVKYKGMLYNDVPFDSSYNIKATYEIGRASCRERV